MEVRERMKNIPIQTTLAEYSEEYKAFVEKFKPKKTTDDCYTPDNVYEAVLEWVCERYDVKPENVVRPFWPGGDYMRFPYKSDSVVVDNPPFSILSQIIDFYLAHEIPFFLFAPTLTNFSSGMDKVCHVIVASAVTYENGAVVDTSFITNMDDLLVLADTDLAKRIKEEDEKNRKAKAKSLPKYAYPPQLVTAAMVRYIVSHGVPYRLKKSDAFHVRALDHQRTAGKTIFGGGFLISEKAAAEKAAAEKAAAEKAAAEKWKLSDRELQIVAELSRE